MNQASPQTLEFLDTLDALHQFGDITDDEHGQIRAMVMFYVLDGWDQAGYPFPQMPDWLKPRYWDTTMSQAIRQRLHQPPNQENQ